MSDGDPNRFPKRRYICYRAGIIHKQFLLLENDVAEAERLLAPLMNRSKVSFDHMYGIVQKELEGEADPAAKVLEELNKILADRKKAAKAVAAATQEQWKRKSAPARKPVWKPSDIT